ncbi:MAG: aminofutalosine synthase MqnE [Desulfovibrionaceae bacterium]
MIYEKHHYSNIGLAHIYDKVMQGERLSAEEGIQLFENKNLLAIGALAHHIREKMHQNKTFYVKNRHVNYSNVCVNTCSFCAFKRASASDKGAFESSHDTILEELSNDTTAFSEIHIVGGCHPSLPLSWFLELLTKIKGLLPKASIKMFTAAEIGHLATLEGISTKDVLIELKNAGSDMLTGGGAEIFEQSIRDKICPTKVNAQEWLDIHNEAHSLGFLSNCTMLFGHIENYQNRVDHLCLLREQQDKSGGFSCFIPLPFQHKNNILGKKLKEKGSLFIDRMKTIAISRLLLDNIPHIKAYWIMLGVKEAQTALHFGADDIDGTIVEEKIGHWAGAKSQAALQIDELKHMITHSGFLPVSRDACFNVV